MAKTVEIVVTTTSEAAEIAAEFLSAHSYSGIAIKDKNDILQLQKERRNTWDYIDDSLFAELDDKVFVSSFVEKSKSKRIVEELTAEFAALKENITEIDFGSLEIRLNSVDETEWQKSWKKNFRPIKIGSVVICPKWIRYDESAGESVVLLNSGIAFGTGEHETTAMCIELLQKQNLRNKVVFDVGCGSGILGITAAKLGAEKCILTDIDTVAIAAARQNIRLNKVGKIAAAESKNLLEGKSERADIILANLTAGLLELLCGGIKTAAKDQCTVIVSGIINAKIDEVVDCYTAQGFVLAEKVIKNEWCAMAFILGEK